jgi:hypothetical protein
MAPRTWASESAVFMMTAASLTTPSDSAATARTARSAFPSSNGSGAGLRRLKRVTWIPVTLMMQNRITIARLSGPSPGRQRTVSTRLTMTIGMPNSAITEPARPVATRAAREDLLGGTRT